MQKKLKFGFLMDPIEKIKVDWDSTIPQMIESQKRGHLIYYIETKDLFVDKGLAMVNLRPISVGSAVEYTIGEGKIVRLDSLDAIFMRIDPPFELDYLYCTYILDLVVRKVFVVNHPQGLRNANEKFFINFFQDFMPPTIVTKNTGLILDFLKKHKDIVIKLMKGYGGHHILRIRINDDNYVNKIKKMSEGDNTFVMVQKFLKGVEKGDKRITVLNGKVLFSVFKRTKKGEYKANLSHGGVLEKTILSKREKYITKVICKELSRQKIYFAGIDLVDDKLLEINVTSPSLIPGSNKLYGVKFEEKIIDFVEKKCFSNK